MEGTDQLYALLEFPMSLHMAVDQAKADGKISLEDVGLLVTPAMKLGPAIAGLKGGALKEWKDLDSSERDALSAKIKAAYNIADDKLEATIEGALDVLLHIGQFVGLVTPAPAPAE